MSNEKELVGPIDIIRESDGTWYHPAVAAMFPDADVDPDQERGIATEKWAAFLAENRLEVTAIGMEWDASDEVCNKYYEEGDPDFSGWEPTSPGEGWFILAICDTEDGPQCWFARRISE